MNLIPSLNTYKGTLASFLGLSRRIFKVYDQLMVNEEPQQFYLGNNVDVPSGLLPFQTAVKTHRPVAINVTATATAAQIKKGVITSTSAAATSITLPTATLLATALGAARGTFFDFVIDNSVGASVVTIVVGSGITATPVIITGSATLTVAIGSVGLFRIYFISATAAILYRVG